MGPAPHTAPFFIRRMGDQDEVVDDQAQPTSTLSGRRNTGEFLSRAPVPFALLLGVSGLQGD